MSKPRAIKVNFQGETKRLKLTNSYETLALQTRETFGQDLAKVWPIKFYYLDDESELISITSQSDFQEALSIEDFSMLKLTVAANVQEARMALERQMSETMSLASLNNSQFLSQAPRMSLISEDKFSTAPKESEDYSPFAVEIPDSERRDYKKIHHEMGCGSDSVSMHAQGTDVHNLVGKDEIGVMTKQTVMANANTATELATNQAAIQAGVLTREQGCDGVPKVQYVNGGSQMEVVKHETQEVECNLLVPGEESSEECIEEQLDCFKCKGTQVNQKGLPCRKCNGSGQFNLQGFGNVIKVVKEEIEAFCTDSFKSLYQDYQDKKRENQASQVHAGFVCDSCNVSPITGVRFMCSVCADYDLCQVCEAKNIHNEHPMLKIRKANQAPAKLVCQYPNSHNLSAMNQSVDSSTFSKASSHSQQEDVQKVIQGKNASNKKPRYQGRFVKESFTDKHQVQPGETFTKQWTYRNGGEVAWPSDVVFMQTSGDQMESKTVQIKNAVEPGSDYIWEVQMKAPERIGRYTAFFRMQTGHSVRFGHKVWCDIQVVEPVQPEPVEQPKLVEESKPVEQPEPIKMSISDVFNKEDELGNSFEVMADGKAGQDCSAFEGLGDKQVSADPIVSAQVEKPVDLTQSQVLPKIKSPKDIYFEKVASIGDALMRDSLKNLYDFGFIDFKKNHELMKKHKNIETVAAILLEGSGQQ